MRQSVASPVADRVVAYDKISSSQLRQAKLKQPTIQMMIYKKHKVS